MERVQKKTPKETVVDKKPDFTQHEFKCDYVVATISKRLKTTVIRMYFAVKPIILYKTISSLLQLKIDRYAYHFTTNCIYKFTCACQISQTGRTEKRAYDRLQKCMSKSVRLVGLKTSNTDINSLFLLFLQDNNVVGVFQVFNTANIKLIIS